MALITILNINAANINNLQPIGGGGRLEVDCTALPYCVPGISAPTFVMPCAAA